jgi:AcrR family transcriptional regulator
MEANRWKAHGNPSIVRDGARSARLAYGGAMARARVPRPRRLPTARNPRVVEAVIDAAHRILATDGYDAMSTNRVARVAGVSVGSLYHYFPTKEAIVAELARRFEQQGLDLALQRLAEGATWKIPSLVRALLGILVSPEIGLVAARRALFLRVPPRWFADASMSVDRAVHAWFGAAIEQRRAELREGPSDVMAFVAYHAVEGVVEATIAQRPERVLDPAFFDELVRLLVGYVSPAST